MTEGACVGRPKMGLADWRRYKSDGRAQWKYGKKPKSDSRHLIVLRKQRLRKSILYWIMLLSERGLAMVSGKARPDKCLKVS